MKIFVATYESGGNPFQTVKKTRKEALEWLKKQHKRDFSEDGDATFKEWCEYGAWTGKIKSFNIK